jgi:hypothetical protein
LTVGGDPSNRDAELQRGREEITTYYSEALKAHGPSHLAVGSKNVSSQLVRFEKLAYILNPALDEL